MSPGRELSNRSVFSRFASTPRFLWLMAALVVTAMSAGAREIVRIDYASDAIGSSFGIGVVAAVFAITLAVSNIAFGRLCDRHDPRWYLILPMFVGAVIITINAWTLTRGPLSVPWLIASTVVDGITFGMATTGLVKVQAAMVPADSRGAAETVNILRAGLGAAVGTALTGLSPNASTTLIICAVAQTLIAVIVIVLVRPVHASTSGSARSPVRSVIDAARTAPALARTIRVDLVLSAVLPTQFVALVVVDQDVRAMGPLALSASLGGVLFGRLALVVRGLDGNLVRLARRTYLGFLCLIASSPILLHDGWILDRPIALAATLFVGSSLLGFTQNLPIALLQQQVPESIRGTLSGTMNAARNLLIAGVAALLAALTAISGAVVLAMVLTVLLFVGFFLTDRFRGLTVSGSPRTAAGNSRPGER